MHAYLASSTFIDWKHPAIEEKAIELATAAHSEEDLVKRSFELVRDTIKHSWDYKLNPVTLVASDVLKFGTGYCYAKSHLLAALLRANGIPAGLCYQRLAVSAEEGSRFCLHGLNAVHLKNHGWYRVDARGNKPGVDAQFTPPMERLAFPILSKEERDLPEIWPEPLPVVVAALAEHGTVQQVFNNLPDIELY